MKLLFVSPSPLRFTVATPGFAPVGGTESAIAYLARHLAARGHAVTLLACLPDGAPASEMGVRHAPFPDAGDDPGFYAANDFDAIVIATMPRLTQHMRMMAPRALQVSWIHLMPHHGNLQSLDAMAQYIDCAVFVSDFQHRAFRQPLAAQVIGNGIAPAFENMFASAAELKAVKQNRAAYTSTPYRGLDVLAHAFPLAQIETALDIYSGMALYQEQDTEFTALYDMLRAAPRSHMQGPLGQDALAKKLKPAAFLAYPATEAETYCIAALEAIAAGMKVVSTGLGALQESTLGFADLLPLPAGITREGLAPLFAAHLKRAVDQFLRDPDAWAQERFAQSQVVSRQCSWASRAQAWENFLGPAIAWKRGA